MTDQIRRQPTHFDAEALRRELDERMAAQQIDASWRREAVRAAREQFGQRRKIGLQRRHAQKLQRMEGNQ